MGKGEATKSLGGFRLSHIIAVPIEPIDGVFILGDRIRTRFQGHHGTVVSINLPAWERGWSPEQQRPYQVLLDDQPNRLRRYNSRSLTLL